MSVRFQDIDWTHWTPQEHATLLFVRQADRVLLIRKKRGLGARKINGPGGRLDDRESPRQVFPYPMARIGLLEMCDNLGRSLGSGLKPTLCNEIAAPSTPRRARCA